MSKLQQLFGRFIGMAVMTVFCTTYSSMAQQTIDKTQPAQGAQVGQTEVADPFSSATKENSSVVKEKNTYTIPQVVAPANATQKQTKQIAKLNKTLAKVSEQQASKEVRKENTFQKMATQMTLRKVSKKIDKMGVEKTTEIKKIQEAAKANSLNNLALIGLILALVGLVFLLAVDGTVGILLLVVGLVLLLVGLINE